MVYRVKKSGSSIGSPGCPCPIVSSTSSILEPYRSSLSELHCSIVATPDVGSDFDWLGDDSTPEASCSTDDSLSEHPTISGG